MPTRPARYRLGLTIVCAALSAPLSACNGVPGLDTVTGIFTSDKREEAAAARKNDGTAVFEAGDKYTFDNPVERWEVMEVRDDRVYWRNEKGERKVTGFNPILPAYEWQSRVNGSGRRFIRDMEGALFPMRVGARLSFRETATTDRPPFGWEYIWRCTVEGEETLRTLGGSFQTFVVRCEREGAGTLVYHYAPKIGNFLVRRAEKGEGQPDVVRNLLAFERADGTVVAGIVPGNAGPTKTSVPEPANRDRTPGPALQSGQPKQAIRAINPPRTASANVATRNVAASLVLAQPVFGGRPTPPAPLPPERETQPAVSAPAGNLPPPATPAPLAAVQRAEPAKPAPVRPAPRASPRRPRSSAPAHATGPAGPRMASAPVFGASRERIPVPPPPVATRRVPPPPAPVAVPSSVPPPPPRAAVPPPPPVAVPAVPPAPKPVAAIPAVPPPPVPVAPGIPPAPSAQGGQRMVHLASYRTVDDAEQGWHALQSAHTELLPLTPKVRPVVVKGKGTFYRLYAGPLDSAAAEDLCRKLKGAGVFCMPAG